MITSVPHSRHRSGPRIPGEVISEAPMRFATPRFVDFVCFLLLLSGPPLLRQRDATASLRGEIDASIVLRLVAWAGGLAWLLLRLYPVLIERRMIPRVGMPQVLGGLLLLVLAAAIPIAPGLLLTTFAIYQLAVTLGFSWVFAQLYGPEIYVRYLFWGYLLLAIAIIISWIFLPELVVWDDRPRGDLIAPAGPVGALGLMLCLSGAIRLRKGAMLVMSGIFAVPLVASQTRVALAAFLAVLVLGWLVRYPAPMKKALPILVVGLLVAALFGVLSSAGEFAIREGQGLTTLSARIPLWQHLVGTMLRDSPVIGLGYYSASRVLGPQVLPALGNAHSAFVEVLVGGGLLAGLVFFSLYGVLIVSAARLLAHGRDHPLTFAVLGLFSITALLSVTNTSGIQSGPTGFTFWSVTALIPTLSHMRAEAAHQRAFQYAHLTHPYHRATLANRAVPAVSHDG